MLVLLGDKLNRGTVLVDVSMYCPHGDTSKYSGREDWSAEENRDEVIDLGANVCVVCVCVHLARA